LEKHLPCIPAGTDTVAGILSNVFQNISAIYPEKYFLRIEIKEK